MMTVTDSFTALNLALFSFFFGLEIRLSKKTSLTRSLLSKCCSVKLLHKRQTNVSYSMTEAAFVKLVTKLGRHLARQVDMEHVRPGEQNRACWRAKGTFVLCVMRKREASPAHGPGPSTASQPSAVVRPRAVPEQDCARTTLTADAEETPNDTCGKQHP